MQVWYKGCVLAFQAKEEGFESLYLLHLTALRSCFLFQTRITITNKEVKEKWLAALRSGEYKQGRNALRRNNNFCCLGVLCDIYSEEKNVPWEKLGDHDRILDCKSILPDKIKSWAELPGQNPSVEHTDLHSGKDNKTLAGLNDIYHCDFNQIADIIEKNF